MKLNLITFFLLGSVTCYLAAAKRQYKIDCQLYSRSDQPTKTYRYISDCPSLKPTLNEWTDLFNRSFDKQWDEAKKYVAAYMAEELGENSNEPSEGAICIDPSVVTQRYNHITKQGVWSYDITLTLQRDGPDHVQKFTCIRLKTGTVVAYSTRHAKEGDKYFLDLVSVGMKSSSCKLTEKNNMGPFADNMALIEC